MSKLKARRIKTTPSYSSNLSLGGWYDGKKTYLWLGTADKQYSYGYISGSKLYRLAKFICKEFERDSN